MQRYASQVPQECVGFRVRFEVAISPHLSERGHRGRHARLGSGNRAHGKGLADKGYHYRFVFTRNSKHVDGPTIAQTLPSALEWLWKGFPAL